LCSYFSVGETAGLNGQKHSIFAGGVRVPFLVRWPGVVPAGRVDTSTALASVDLLPTFADLAGVSLPDNYKPDGQSIAKAIKGEPFKRDKIIFWQWKSAANRPYFWANAGIQEDNWRLLVNEKLGKKELYNINSDWGEQKDIIESHTEKAQKLLLKLNKWEKSLPTEPSSDCFSAERKTLK
jgi:N-acetylgalactosamine-6-sulfatase